MRSSHRVRACAAISGRANTMWSAWANVSAMSRPKPSEQVIVNSASTLGAPALAFLAGFGVETVFRMLDGLAEQFSSARK